MLKSSRRSFLKYTGAGFLASLLSGGLPSSLFSLTYDDVLARRKEYLAVLLKIIAPTRSRYLGRINDFDKTWEDWLKRTGELPPDFLNMPSVPLLHDPFLPLDGKGPERITTFEEWERQRGLIRAEFEHWIFGTMPPAPDNMSVAITSSRIEGDATVKDVRLDFGPSRRRARLRLELLIPPGDGPFPVFVTNHPRRRPWVNTAMRRGYLGCIYYALDPYYRAGDDSEAWLSLYPEYDFSAIARWAWGAMRAADYLHTLPYVDKEAIAIGGHSRNSKSALLAAAFDDRFKAVVPSRGNTGDQMPWRFASDVFMSESLEEVTRVPHWFHPRLRFFSGREHKLTVDQHLLLALVAPRGLIMSHAYMEHQGNPVGFEQSYRAVREVYKFFGKDDHLAMYQQPGEHPSSVTDIENYFDFFDTVFGRKRFAVPRMWIHGYDYDEWLQRSGVRIDPLSFEKRDLGDFWTWHTGGSPITADTWSTAKGAIQEAIQWSFGDEPPGVPLPPRDRAHSPYTMIRAGWRGQLLKRPFRSGGRVGGRRFELGDDIRGELYFPTGPEPDTPRDSGGDAIPEGASFPAIIWLHPYSYNIGYSRFDYWSDFVNRGFAVVTFDQIGFGVRNGQSLGFYDRYPAWSLLGKMVVDTRAAVDALLAETFVDPSRIYLSGWSLGGKIALYTAAIDDRVCGVSAACGFAPLRTHTRETGTEGIHHYSHIHGLLPRLGFFIGNETRLPVDYDEVLACIAPRPLQIIAPTLDRYNRVEDVTAAVEKANRVYQLMGRTEGISLETPLDLSRYVKAHPLQIDWLARTAGLPGLDAGRESDSAGGSAESPDLEDAEQ